MVELLLRADARTGTVNNLGKTATSMAAFVGKSQPSRFFKIGRRIKGHFETSHSYRLSFRGKKIYIGQCIWL